MEKQKFSPVSALTSFFSPPDVMDPEKERIVSLLNFLTGMMVVVVVLSLIAALSVGTDRMANLRAYFTRVAPILTVFIVSQVLMRTKHTPQAAYVLTIGYWINATIEVFFNGGVFAPNLASFIISIIVAGLLLGARASIFTAVVSFVAVIGVAVLQTRDLLPAPVTPAGVPNHVISISVAIVSVVGLLYLYLRQLNQAFVQLRKTNDELSLSRQVLEQRVVERTQMLETSMQISRRLSTILDIGQLVRSVVDELLQAFHYYHVHIYLFDEGKENLVMTGGTGEAGRAMLAKGHQIPRGKGLVGRAAEEKRSVLVSDTYQDPAWLPNPLLPETRSELAVPIISGDQVVGVLDVQQNRVGGLTPVDVNLMQSIANQVAIAVLNAQAYAQVQLRAEREIVAASISQKIQQASTIDEVLQVAVLELSKALDAQQAVVELHPAVTPGIGQN